MSRTADSMVSAMMMDLWPSIGAIADFGVTEQNIGDALPLAAGQPGCYPSISLLKLLADDERSPR